jgi:hydroxyacylglutathione hydrolase
MHIFPIPAFKDNYIWVITTDSSNSCIVVDPGNAKAVINALHEKKLNLIAVLITHNHWDHTNGINELKTKFNATVYGSANSHLDNIDIRLKEHDLVNINELNFKFSVLEIPGHTLDHIAFYNNEVLFCGDTLFSAGCGRLFEGTPAQMLDSLRKLKQLPSTTQVYCAHEYTQNNIKFALHIEPNNNYLKNKIVNLPSLPSTIKEELLINPFFRTQEPSIITAASKHAKKELTSEVDVFAAIRHWKDDF